MGIFRRLRRAMGMDADARPPADLRRRIEEAIARNELEPLAELLRQHPEPGKVLIREYEREMREADDPLRAKLAERITALVGVYARVLGDAEPLSWFRAPGPPSPDSPADVALEQAQHALTTGDFAQAFDIAMEGLSALAPAESAQAGAEKSASSLHAVRGAAAANLGRLDEAAGHFERSLEHALRSDSTEARAAARLNLLDLSTRRGAYPVNDPALEQTIEATMGTRYEDALGKLLLERGVSLAARGELGVAIATFDRVLAFRPTWPFPLYQRAWARFLQGDSGGALDDYREVAANHPIFFTVQREIRCLEDVAAARLPIEAYRSFCLVRGRVTADAAGTAAAAERMVERFPDFTPGWLLLAEGRLALGQRDEARAAVHEALRHDPDADTATAALFAEWNLARAAGEADAVRSAADRLTSAYPGHPATEIVARLGNETGDQRTVRWTWALDGTLSVQEVPREGETLPPPGSPG